MTTQVRQPIGGYVAVAAGGAAVAALGSFGPWVRASSGLFTVSKYGMDGDGIYTLAVACLAAAVAIGMLGSTKAAAVVTIAVATILGWIGVGEVIHMYWVTRNSGVTVSPDWGLFLVIAGATAAIIGATLAWARAEL